ncbi:hypothetical protein [Prochlorococcus marinus]|uniref:hypothetical protein n=1 Tax=Prochlorococcus marinus TaxID=1219 RepID=UPI0022B5D013|nr:hypothetical protein [Prochlorococcus marinus]
MVIKTSDARKGLSSAKNLYIEPTFNLERGRHCSLRLKNALKARNIRTWLIYRKLFYLKYLVESHLIG